jgi:hypothetical protein
MISLNADMKSVCKRLSNRSQEKRAFENLSRLFSNKNPLPLPKHEYVRESESGIGFCLHCYSDNMNDGNHY